MRQDANVTAIHGHESSGLIEIEVPEHLVGAICGKAMKTLQVGVLDMKILIFLPFVLVFECQNFNFNVKI